MTPTNDHRTGPHRPGAPPAAPDEATRSVIRSDRVRYPGVEAQPSPDRPYLRTDGRVRKLRPARDAGLSIERRRARERRKAARAHRNRVIAGVILVALLLVLGIAWRWVSDSRAAHAPALSRTGAGRVPAMSAMSRQSAATPYFASYKDVRLRLPVEPADLTELGFHQASYSYALPMKTPLPDADMASAKKTQTTHRDLSAQSVSADATLTGSVLRMWRSRPGKPNTAVDVGADPGTRVLAPMDGTVLLVKEYQLYGRYKDTQIHIRPDGAPKVDVVLIHVKQPTVKAGDRVMAGVTPLGVVRKLSDKLNLQLEHYTKASGDHVHLQLNDVTDPSYKGLKDVEAGS